MTVTAQLVNELRQKTGAGMMACKKALVETDGNLDKAIDALRVKGLSSAAKKSGRIATEGLVSSYIHAGGRIGVLLEVNCETDFVSQNEHFSQFVKDLCLHIVANKPKYVEKDEVPPEEIEKEKEIARTQAIENGKPENIVTKIAEGKAAKYCDEVCLMEQGFVKDPSKKVNILVKEMIAKIGENIKIRRFQRWELGEGLEKKNEDFAAEVAATMGA